MIVLDALSRKNDYKLRIFKADFRTITFDEIVIVYARDGILFENAKWNNELKKYENQLKLKNDRLYHRNSFIDSWMSYIDIWIQFDFLNHIHKIYEHCSVTTMHNIIRVKQWWFNMKRDIRYFVRHCLKCQLTAKSRDTQRKFMHSLKT